MHNIREKIDIKMDESCFNFRALSYNITDFEEGRNIYEGLRLIYNLVTFDIILNQ